MSCVSLFMAASERVPDRVALVEGARSVTYRELRELGQQCASRLRAAGIAPGDRVVVLVPMSIDLYGWILGMLWADATVMFVEPWMPLDLIAGCCAKAKPQAILASPLGFALAQRAPAFRKIPLKLVTRFGSLLSLVGWRAPPASGPQVPPPSAGADDMAVLTFTTGSSGTPKGVVRTHGLLETQHRVLSKSLHLTSDDVCMHAFANFILNNLALGATSVLPSIKPSAPTKFSPAAIAAEIERARVTSLVCPPASLERLVAWAQREQRTLPSVRSLATGGGPVPLSLLERAAQVFPSSDPEILYGSSEVEPVAHIAWSEVRALSGDGVCVGKPVDEVRVRLMDKGEIVVSGAHVSPRYFEDPEAMAKTKIAEGDTLWHRMGDTASLDAQGRLWLTGRVHNLIETAQGTVLPMVIERRAEALAFVAGAAAVGINAEAVLAIEPREWLPSSFEGWRTSLSPHIGSARVLFVREIPRDRRHRSKVDYAGVRALVERSASP